MNKRYKKSIAKQIATEGIVLLKNENKVLPLSEERVAAFGRTFYYCLKGGAGSGDVLGIFPVNPYEALKETKVDLCSEVSEFYNAFNSERYDPELKYWNRYNCEWVNSLPEPSVPDVLIENAAETCKKAIINIGRSSGEWFDIPKEKGSFYLTDEEISLIERVKKNFDHVILILNTYGVIDTEFIKKYNFDAVLYVSMGGEEMGNAVSDVLVGNASPCGKLADSWAPIDSYPTHEGFDTLNIPYKEGIYVGYRYFDSFGITPDFHFGFGLSYSQFRISPTFVRNEGTNITVGAKVQNVGDYDGKEVVQVYLSEPQGKLHKAYQQLAAFKKTESLIKGEECDVELSFDLADFAAFNEENAEFVLEKGNYLIRLGNSSRNTEVIAKLCLNEDAVTFKTVNRLPLKQKLDLIKTTPESFYSYEGENGEIEIAPVLNISQSDIKLTFPKALKEDEFLKGKGSIKFSDVRSGRASLDEFVAELSDEQLSDILNGVTSKTLIPNLNVGTMAVTIEGAAGEIWSSKELDIPPCVNADGPTGVRLGGFIDKVNKIPRDSELSLKMTAFPIATCIANTWNLSLAKAFGEAVSDDMSISGLNGWLAPALNIHRNPLCGRNFEYFSEDPLISGEMAAAVVIGIQLDENGESKKHYATIKHFAANNAEKYRFDSDSVVSERALREIYLKGFKIAVQKGKPYALMNSYNKINGEYASDSVDLNKGILRSEWGFDGCVMTDWDCKSHSELMPKAGCDLVMPGFKNEEYLNAIRNGTINKADAQLCAKNILALVLKTT